MKKQLLLITLVIVILDQLTKILVKKLNLWHTVNNGLIFGFLKNTNTIAIIASALILLLGIYYYKKLPKQKLPIAATALVLGGVTGNLIDRILFGGVIDFIRIWKWPAFNIADSAITAGVMGLIVYFWRR